MAKKEAAKKEEWGIVEVMAELRKLGMEVTSIQGAVSQDADYKRTESWNVYFPKKKLRH